MSKLVSSLTEQVLLLYLSLWDRLLSLNEYIYGLQIFILWITGDWKILAQFIHLFFGCIRVNSTVSPGKLLFVNTKLEFISVQLNCEWFYFSSWAILFTIIILGWITFTGLTLFYHVTLWQTSHFRQKFNFWADFLLVLPTNFDNKWHKSYIWIFCILF